MKSQIKKYVLLILLTVIGCADFPTRYDLVEENKVRLLDFVYEPPEAAPGDTVNLTAVFAGKEVNAEMIDWTVSYKVVESVYGPDTAFEIRPLQCNPVQGKFSDRTSCITFSFVIPDSLMYYSPMIKNNWSEILPEEYRRIIPESFKSMTKYALIDTVEKLISYIETVSTTGMKTSDMSALEMNVQDLEGLLPVLSAKIRLFADVQGAYTIQSDYGVRYNRAVSKISPEYSNVNNNPVIDSVIVYKVEKKDMIQYDPFEVKQTAYRLFGEERDSVTVIPVDRECTYFIHSFTSNKDSSISLGGVASAEEHTPQYYYEHDPVEVGAISQNNFMNVGRIDNDSIYLLSPPENSIIKSFTLWLEIQDRFYNEYDRPTASMLKEFRGRFEYRD